MNWTMVLNIWVKDIVKRVPSFKSRAGYFASFKKNIYVYKCKWNNIFTIAKSLPHSGYIKEKISNNSDNTYTVVLIAQKRFGCSDIYKELFKVVWTWFYDVYKLNAPFIKKSI